MIHLRPQYCSLFYFKAKADIIEPNHIVVIDDDDDDCELFKAACIDLQVTNEIIAFNNSIEAFDYLNAMNMQPFFIVCDVNMPFINGLELRQKINEKESLRLKAVPFLFWSTSGSESLINKAYSLNIQGFFKKPSSIKELREILSAVMEYWNYSHHPLI